MLVIENLRKEACCPDGKRLTILALDALRVEAGEQLAITGPSGSGKTTLLHVVAGLLRPSAGALYFEGARMDAWPRWQWEAWRARSLGYVFQKYNLLDTLTAEENVLLAAALDGHAGNEARDQARELLAAVGLEDKRGLRPSRLSGGEQQRVAVARALMGCPKLVLADEPTASLDAQSGAQVLVLLQRLCAARGSALLLSTHDPRVMAVFVRRCELGEQRCAS